MSYVDSPAHSPPPCSQSGILLSLLTTPGIEAIINAKSVFLSIIVRIIQNFRLEFNENLTNIIGLVKYWRYFLQICLYPMNFSMNFIGSSPAGRQVG